MNNYLHFDGYQFHLKENDEEKFLIPEILKKHKYVKGKKHEPPEDIYTPETPKKVKIKKKDFIPEFEPTKVKIKKKISIPALHEESKELIQKIKKPKKVELIKPKTKTQIMGKDTTIEQYNNLMEHYETNHPEIYKKKVKELNDYLKYEAKLKKSQPHIDPKYFNIH